MAEKAGDKGHHEDNSVQKKPALFPYSKLTAFQWFTDVPFFNIKYNVVSKQITSNITLFLFLLFKIAKLF